MTLVKNKLLAKPMGTKLEGGTPKATPEEAETLDITPAEVAHIDDLPWFEEPSEGNSICVYGAPKSGKTELVGKLAEKFKLIWIDFENGHATLRKLPIEWKRNIQMISIPDNRDFPIGIETALKVIRGDEVSICKEHGKVTCQLCKKDAKPTTLVNLDTMPEDTIVVMDSMTQLADSAMAHITKGTSDDYKFDWDDYRKQGTVMSKFLGFIQQKNYKIVVIAHEAEVEMDDGKKKLVPVAGSSTFSRNAAKYFDHVVYCAVKNKAHAFGSSTTFGNSLVTGSRTGIAIEGSVGKETLIDIFEGKTASTTKVAVAGQNKAAAALMLKAKARLAKG